MDNRQAAMAMGSAARESRSTAPGATVMGWLRPLIVGLRDTYAYACRQHHPPTSADRGAPVAVCKPCRFDWQVYGIDIEFA